MNAVTENLIEPVASLSSSPRDSLCPELRTPLVRGLLAALPDFLFVLDSQLKVVIASRDVGQRSAQELEGKPITEVFPPHLQAIALSTMHRVLANRGVDGFSAEIEGFDGQHRHFDVKVAPFQAQDRNAWLTVVATEITDQVRAERAIATQARMIESMLEGVAVINERGMIEMTNPAFDTMFGYRRGDLIGREMVSLAGWPFEQPERWQRNGSPGAASQRVEFDGRRADGSHFAAAGVLSTFEVIGRNHSLVVLQDVSERKQLERAILEAVNREQYRIGNDLHDGLGQELTGIALMMRGLAGRVGTEYAPVLPEIEGIMRLVNNAIESTRALARGLSPVNLERGGLQDALDGLAMHAAEIYGVEVVCTHRLVAPHPLSAELANHLYRIAQEAVRNAVRHGNARLIRLHLHVARAKVRLTITDDGKGMPAQSENAPGMGLKIMRYRARILGGEVSFESGSANGGTRIVCECPIELGQTKLKTERKSVKSSGKKLGARK